MVLYTVFSPVSSVFFDFSESTFSDSSVSMGSLTVFLTAISPAGHVPDTGDALSGNASLLTTVPLAVFSTSFSPVHSEFLVSSILD